MARRTKAEAAATREALLDAAEEMFFDQGVARTSLEQIARHAGMTRGAVYWHFKNKADILHALLDRVHMPFEELIDEIDDPQLAASSPLETIRLASHHALARLEQPRHQRVLSIIIHRCEFFGDINPLQMQEDLARDCYQSLHKHFTRAAEQGLLVDNLSPAMAAHLLQSTLAGLVHDWLHNPEAFSIHRRGCAMVDTLLGLLQASPSA
ncbi:TetR family transcriptional regulator [Halomonas cerina]|uniref:TetR/AcrR family acrAB operon transcriptional repressor n=1 Tax=Halomonas cerina TaxID=447424 RepID=A0A839V7R1_9GAMM|nr:TetR family transcriptional regulator [Halomonas cerina]MBB3191482.1 TetR/AcrR family acrAB operon transcriptional repressor [Halomonas cerina]